MVTSHVSHLVSRQAAALALAVVVVGGGGADVVRGNEVTDLVARVTRADEAMRPGCRAALARHTAAAWCDPAKRSVARLRSTGRKLRHVDDTRAVRLAGAPLDVGQRVRVRARHVGRRAQLVLVVRDGDSVTYARFAGMGRGTLAATAYSRATPEGLLIRLRTRRRTRRPVLQLTASMPRPPAPAPHPRPSPPSRLVIQECGEVAPSTAEDVDEFNALWGTARSGPGWTGGDVTFSAPLPDGRTAWIFGDSFIGHVTADGRRTGGLVHNSIVIQDGPCLTTYADGTPSTPDALIRPAAPTTEWYWPADATVEDDHLHVLIWRVRSTGSGAWDFEVVGTELATLALPALDKQQIRPLSALPGVAWGSAIAADVDRTYVYGIHVHADGERWLHTARTTSDLEGPWEYRTADGWSGDPQASADQLPGISHQVSVVRDGDEYFLITQDPRLGPDIALFRATTPWGPWAPAAEPLANAAPPLPDTFTYNAAAHPEFTAGGLLLLSYNVNSLMPDDALSDAAIYHPRFIAVPWPPAPMGSGPPEPR